MAFKIEFKIPAAYYYFSKKRGKEVVEKGVCIFNPKSGNELILSEEQFEEFFEVAHL